MGDRLHPTAEYKPASVNNPRLKHSTPHLERYCVSSYIKCTMLIQDFGQMVHLVFKEGTLKRKKKRVHRPSSTSTSTESNNKKPNLPIMSSVGTSIFFKSLICLSPLIHFACLQQGNHIGNRSFQVESILSCSY